MYHICCVSFPSALWALLTLRYIVEYKGPFVTKEAAFAALASLRRAG